MLSKARPHAAVIDFILIIHISGNAAAWLWVVIRVSVGHGPSGSCDSHSGLGSADQPNQGQRRAPGACVPTQRRDGWGSHRSTHSTPLPSGSLGPPGPPRAVQAGGGAGPAWAHHPLYLSGPFPCGHGPPSTPEQPRNHGPVRGGAEERPLRQDLGRTGPKQSRHPPGHLAHCGLGWRSRCPPARFREPRGPM